MTSPNARLSREHAAAALTAAGFPTAPATLATRASRGGGPPYQRYGARAVYRWGDLLEWAEARLSAPMRSTSEGDLRRSRQPAQGGL
jgi:hypothetical protein